MRINLISKYLYIYILLYNGWNLVESIGSGQYGERSHDPPDSNISFITVNVQRKENTDKILYESNERDRTETFTARDNYVINKIRNGNYVEWEASKYNYAKKLLLKYDDNGDPKLTLYYNDPAKSGRTEISANYGTMGSSRKDSDLMNSRDRGFSGLPRMAVSDPLDTKNFVEFTVSTEDSEDFDNRRSKGHYLNQNDFSHSRTPRDSVVEGSEVEVKEEELDSDDPVFKIPNYYPRDMFEHKLPRETRVPRSGRRSPPVYPRRDQYKFDNSMFDPSLSNANLLFKELAELIKTLRGEVDLLKTINDLEKENKRLRARPPVVASTDGKPALVKELNASDENKNIKMYTTDHIDEEGALGVDGSQYGNKIVLTVGDNSNVYILDGNSNQMLVNQPKTGDEEEDDKEKTQRSLSPTVIKMGKHAKYEEETDEEFVVEESYGKRTAAAAPVAPTVLSQTPASVVSTAPVKPSVTIIPPQPDQVTPTAPAPVDTTVMPSAEPAPVAAAPPAAVHRAVTPSTTPAPPRPVLPQAPIPQPAAVPTAIPTGPPSGIPRVTPAQPTAPAVPASPAGAPAPIPVITPSQSVGVRPAIPQPVVPGPAPVRTPGVPVTPGPARVPVVTPRPAAPAPAPVVRPPQPINVADATQPALRGVINQHPINISRTPAPTGSAPASPLTRNLTAAELVSGAPAAPAATPAHTPINITTPPATPGAPRPQAPILIVESNESKTTTPAPAPAATPALPVAPTPAPAGAPAPIMVNIPVPNLKPPAPSPAVPAAPAPAPTAVPTGTPPGPPVVNVEDEDSGRTSPINL